MRVSHGGLLELRVKWQKAAFVAVSQRPAHVRQAGGNAGSK